VSIHSNRKLAETCLDGTGRIFPGLSVEENLTLGFLQASRRSAADNREVLERVYKRLPRLKERRHEQGTTFSGGEQQMLAVARVLVGDPKVLLIDEPSEGLAPIIVTDIYPTHSSNRAVRRGQR